MPTVFPLQPNVLPNTPVVRPSPVTNPVVPGFLSSTILRFLFGVGTTIWSLNFLGALFDSLAISELRRTLFRLDPLEPDKGTKTKVNTRCTLSSTKFPRNKGCKNSKSISDDMTEILKEVNSLKFRTPRAMTAVDKSHVGMRLLVDMWTTTLKDLVNSVESNVVSNQKCGTPKCKVDKRELVLEEVSICLEFESQKNAT